MNLPSATIRACAWLLPALLAASVLRAQLPAAAAPDFQRALEHFQQGRHRPALQILEDLEKRFPKAADVHHLEAIVLDLLGRPEEANRHFELAVELSPFSVNMRSNYATSLMRLGRRGESIDQFRRVLGQDPDNPTANFNLGTVLLEAERFEEARPHLERAFLAQPDLYANGYQLALCLYFLDAQADLGEVLRKLGPVPADRLEFHLLQALNDRALGRGERAAERLSSLLPRLNQDPATRRLAVALLLSGGLYEEASPLLEAIAREASATAADWMRLAEARRVARDPEGALQAARRANQIQEAGDIHAFMGEVQEELGRSVEAVEHFQRAVALDPSEEHFFALGYEFLSHWNWETARRVLEGGLLKHDGSWRLWLGLGAAFLGQNEMESAAGAFLKSIDRSPHPMAFRLLAQCYEQAGTLQADAARVFERFHRENPEDPKAAYYWAFAKFQDVSATGGPPESLSATRGLLATAIERNPEDFEAHFLLGEIDAYRQDWSAAAAAFSEAVAQRPDHVQARYKLGLALRRTGQTEAARRELEEYGRLKRLQERDVSERVAQTRRFIVELKEP